MNAAGVFAVQRGALLVALLMLYACSSPPLTTPQSAPSQAPPVIQPASQSVSLLKADLDQDGKEDEVLGDGARDPGLYPKVTVISAGGKSLLEHREDVPMRRFEVAEAGAPYPLLLTVWSGAKAQVVTAFVYDPAAGVMKRLLWDGQERINGMLQLDTAGQIQIWTGPRTIGFKYDDGMLRSAPDAAAPASLALSLASSTGHTSRVYLYASDEEEWTAGESSCATKVGTVRLQGHYQFFIEPPGSAQPIRQPLQPYPDGFMTFNSPAKAMFEVLPGTAGKSPDLLIMHQYATCGTTSFAVMALSPDGRSLVHLPFKNEDGTLANLGTGSVERLPDGRLHTSRLNKLTGQTESVTWVIDEQNASVTRDKNAPAG